MKKTLATALCASLILATGLCATGAEESWDDFLKLRQGNEQPSLVTKGGIKPKLVPKDIIVEQLSRPQSPPPVHVPGQPSVVPPAPPLPGPTGQSPIHTPAQAGTVVFASDSILFEYGSARITEASLPQLVQVAEALRDPRLAAIPFFFVDGHTCNIGSDANNCRLSWDRARSIVTFLVTVGRVPPNKIVPRGFGLRDPMYSNDSEYGRILNRRVVLKSATSSDPRDAVTICREYESWRGEYGGNRPDAPDGDQPSSGYQTDLPVYPTPDPQNMYMDPKRGAPGTHPPGVTPGRTKVPLHQPGKADAPPGFHRMDRKEQPVVGQPKAPVPLTPKSFEPPGQ